ncbi:hypothetical protein Pta02_08670 [Planobispora takensis]|uniref:Uncharacterized protein n=1 Tax=Planobispora takensis TaxID=1367882 RepID=A0A8J3SQP5_9ACTN|nr:hypothetical protein Pta02_08670 [Planobispora takensis]
MAARLRASRPKTTGTSEPAAAYGVAVMSWVVSESRSSPPTLATAQAANGATAAQANAVGTRQRRRGGVTTVPPTLLLDAMSTLTLPRFARRL